ncbi:MAG: hypothetical protein IPK15_17625 [Verrucomicrobia bacterium]|nr:hypothetical protein [Verrucomicrobiota bacterium]
MELEHRLQIARDAYLRFLREKLGELKHAHPECATELLVELNNAANPRPFSLSRLDAIHGPSSAPQVSRIAFNCDAGRPHSILHCNGVVVNFSDVSWENVSVSFDAPSFDLAQLGGWLSRWIDEADERTTDESGLLGVIHSISWDSSPIGGWKISIDFGSAPVECALEFIEKIQRQGVEACVIETEDEDRPEGPARG